MSTPIKTVSGQAKLAVQGLGLINAFVDNYDIKRYCHYRELQPILRPYWHASHEIFLYYHHVKIEQPKVRAFIDFFPSKRNIWSVDKSN